MIQPKKVGWCVPVHLLYSKDSENMSGNGKQGSPKRQYPPFYERFIPLALAVIVLAIVFLLIVIVAVALGLFPVSG